MEVQCGSHDVGKGAFGLSRRDTIHTAPKGGTQSDSTRSCGSGWLSVGHLQTGGQLIQLIACLRKSLCRVRRAMSGLRMLRLAG